MKIIRLLIITLPLISAPSCWAEGQALQGAGIQLAYGVANGDAAESTVNMPSSINYYGKQSSFGSVGIGYAYTFGDHFDIGNYLSHVNLGVRLAADLNSSSLGGWKSSQAVYQLKVRQLQQLSLEPGVIVGRNSLIYLAGIYARAGVVVRFDANVDAESSATQIRGWGAGIGVRTQVSRHMSLGLQAEQLTFGSTSLDMPLNQVTLIEKVKQLRTTLRMSFTF